MAFVFVPSVLVAYMYISILTMWNSVEAFKERWLEVLYAIGKGLPIISPIYRLCIIIQNKEEGEKQKSMEKVQNLAQREVLGESTPQFIVQASYMIRYGDVGWVQIVCVVFSFCSIVRVVANTRISPTIAILDKVKVSSVVALGTGLKLTLWALIFANLRYYAFAILLISAIIIAPITCSAMQGRTLSVKGVNYLYSIYNFGVQLSFYHGLWTGLVQWLIIAINLSATGCSIIV